MIRDSIKSAQITAMKAGDKPRLAAVRLILAKLKDRDIELRTASALPVAPKPLPHTTEPSASTSTPVAPSGCGAGVVAGSAMRKGAPLQGGFPAMSLRHRR